MSSVGRFSYPHRRRGVRSREPSLLEGVDQSQKRIKLNDGDEFNGKTFTGIRVKPEIVYEYNMEGMAAVTGTDGDENNTGLNEYGEEVRTGYDIRTAGEGESDDAETDSEGDVDSDDGEADVDSDDGEGDDAETDSEGELAGEPLGAPIVQFVREGCREGDDVPREDLVENLRDRGAAEKTIDFWIGKLLNAGDIVEPDDGFYRR